VSGEAASVERPRPPAETADVAFPARDGTAPWDWDDLYARLGRGLIALGQRRFGLSREDSEEALQRAATSILLAAPSVRSPEAYLTTVFLRECLGTFRKAKARGRRELPMPEGLEKADDACERIEVVCRFRRAFALLTPYCRSVMRACLLEGKTRAEAGEGAVSESAVHKRYRKCLRTLANALG
jgi:DNA-directed RNA polymerase specialized sigma24 family protein